MIYNETPFAVKIDNVISLNVKTHDLLNIYFSSNYIVVDLFLSGHNDCNTTIIYYYQTLAIANSTICDVCL